MMTGCLRQPVISHSIFNILYFIFYQKSYPHPSSIWHIYNGIING